MKGILNNVSEAATRLGHKAAFKLKKISPELLLIGGVACVVGGTIMACKATKKANDILDESREEIEAIQDMTEDEQAVIKNPRKEIAKVRVETIGKLIRIYGPSVAVGCAGIAMIFSSHGIRRKRNGALLASYNALDAAFKSYRQRVLEEEDGKERDHRYLTGRAKDYEQLTDSEMSEMEFVDRINQAAANMVDDYNWYSPYSCRFDANTSMLFSMYPFSNLNIIRKAETIASSRMMEKGYICLNEVLHELGMDPVPWGQLVGRIWDPDDSDLFEIIATEDVPDAPGGSITLEFLCDGLIWDKL